MAELKKDEFIIRLGIAGDVEEHVKNGNPISIEVLNPHDVESGFDLKALSYIKLILKRANVAILSEQNLKDANIRVVGLERQVEILKSELADIKKERDEAVWKGMKIKKYVNDNIK